jgi:GMP synthase-like glutamine amidotransferase
MKNICVIQHTEAEYLGLMEDHFEGRNLRFAYKRPFTHGGMLPFSPDGYDGLILLGGGPYGVVSGHLLPSLGHELRLTREFLAAGLPVIGLELGAVILSVAAGGGAREAPLRMSVETARATAPGHLGGRMPETFPMVCYLRDAPALPATAQVLAADESGEPLVFEIGNSLGFLGHPGAKRGMMEDLIMEFAETPDNTVDGLEAIGQAQAEIAEVLTDLMVGISAQAGLM